MAHAILVQNVVQAKNIDALNRSVKGSVDLDNGNVFVLDTISSVAGEAEVFIATATGASINNVWMAAEPEVVVTAGKYKGLDPDVRNFYNVSGDVFTAFKIKIGDIITLTADAFTGARTAETHAIPVSGGYKLAWNAGASTGAALKLLSTDYISIGGATPYTRVTAYKFEVVAE